LKPNHADVENCVLDVLSLMLRDVQSCIWSGVTGGSRGEGNADVFYRYAFDFQTLIRVDFWHCHGNRCAVVADAAVMVGQSTCV
jgi:hypothetical protein